MTTARDPIAGRVRRESQKGGFRAYGANRKPDQGGLTGRINTPSGREAPAVDYNADLTNFLGAILTGGGVDS